MDPVLSSLMQTNQVGDDGFHWWIGQIETSGTDDPKKSGSPLHKGKCARSLPHPVFL